MNTVISSPHSLFSNSVTRMMLLVVAGLIPGYIAYVYFFGWGVIINSALCVLTAFLCEAGVLRLRQRPLWPYLTDGSALVTALLLALALPPILPWWLAVLATMFAMLLAKHLYGGLGYNPFNPAMVGYAILLIAFPKYMTAWLPARGEHLSLSLLDNLRYNLFGTLPLDMHFDALTQATPLDKLHIQLSLGKTVGETVADFHQFSGLYGVGWDWVSIAFLVGGLFLIYKRVISWQIPVAMLGSLAIIATIAWLVDANTYPNPLFHIFGGASMLGAFFIATDPVSASTTPRGRLIYGAGVGIITYVIRAWGGYPDGVAFGVLLMNLAAPTIDQYTQPRVFGHDQAKRP
ncbi:MAG: electron transport complex subunit RsxD [Gammaproteobacteria bacterium]|nr:electron transport complex subunit RsxD [Gammaproteobacteria bacterium]